MSGTKVVDILAYPRLHITLVGMNNDGYRINGGLGFAIEEPEIKISIVESQKFSFNDNRNSKFDSNQIERLRERLNGIKNTLSLTKDIEISLSGDLPCHSGFGSGTIVRLACIEGLFVINNYEYSIDELVKHSGRGGTSGIGIRTYFEGGFIFDIGHKNIGQELVPSSKAEVDTKESLLVRKGNMPEWKFGVCIPKKKIIPSTSETHFFKEKAKLTQTETYETLYHVTYGVLAGILEEDKQSFINGLKAIQNCKWKAEERKLYGEKLIFVENLIYSSGASTVGMSSLGPGLFFLAPDIEKTVLELRKTTQEFIFYVVTPNNTGRKIEVTYA